MRYLFITITFSIFFISAQAQLSKGTISLEGSVGFGSSSTTAAVTKLKTSNTGFLIQPQIGYFFEDKLEGYLFGAYSHSEIKEAAKKGSSNAYGAGLGLRKYFSMTDKLAFLVGPQLSYLESKNEAATKTKTTDISLYAGFSFYPTPKIGLRAGFGGLGYTHTTTLENGAADKTKTDSFGLNASSSNLSLGLSFLFK